LSVDTRLVWIAVGGFVGTKESFVVGSLLPLIGAEMGVSVGQAALVVSAYSLAYAVGTPVLATVFGRLDRRSLLAGAEAAFAFFALLIAISSTFEWVVLARVGLALAAGLFTATAIATAVAVSPPERRGRAIGAVSVGQTLALVVGVPAAAFLAASFGWHLAYFLIAGLAALAAIALRIGLPGHIAGDVRPLGERLKVLRLPGVPLMLMMMVAFGLAAFVPTTFIAPVSFYSAALGLEFLPLVLLANGVGAVAGANLGGRISDALGARRTLVAMASAQAVVLTIFIGLTSLPPAAAPLALLLTMGALGFIGWSYWAAHSSLLAGLAGPSASLAIALNLTALNIGVALCAFLGGAALDHLGPASVLFVALAFALAALALAVLGRSIRP
jgi:predicted MFS family arabinose efflux permease